VSKAVRLIDEMKDFDKPVGTKVYRGDVTKLKCHQCGRVVPAEDAEWVAVGKSSDPYRPFCTDCSLKNKPEEE
jgi:adenine-specific DNA methylase